MMPDWLFYLLCAAAGVAGTGLLSWSSLKNRLPWKGKYLDQVTGLIGKALDRDETPTSEQARAAIILLNRFDPDLEPELRAISAKIEAHVTRELFGDDPPEAESSTKKR